MRKILGGIAAVLLMSAAVSALELELRDGTVLPGVQLGMSVPNGLMLTTTDFYQQTRFLRLPFSVFQHSSLLALRSWLQRHSQPQFGIYYDIGAARYQQILHGLEFYLAGQTAIQLPPVTSAQDLYFGTKPAAEFPYPVYFVSHGIYGNGSYGRGRLAEDNTAYGTWLTGPFHLMFIRGIHVPDGFGWIGRVVPNENIIQIEGYIYSVFDRAGSFQF